MNRLTRLFGAVLLSGALAASAGGCVKQIVKNQGDKAVQEAVPLTSKTKLPAEKPAAFPFDIWDRVVKAYVNDKGKVDYQGLAKNRADLDLYVAYIEKYSPVTAPELFPTPAAQEAYYINAYNAFVFMNVLDKYEDVKTKKNIYKIIQPFFFKTVFVYGGTRNNLYNLENELIRPQFKDPRVHFALNCASESCPRLPNEAFTPERLEEQLEREAKEFCNDSRNVRLDGNTLYLSEIFSFYGGKDAKPDSDFLVYEKAKGTNPPSRDAAIVMYINRYRDQKLPDHSTLTIKYIPYDWTPNDQSF